MKRKRETKPATRAQAHGVGGIFIFSYSNEAMPRC